ncbi:Ribosomal protein S18 acetylase RimI [Paenibacillus sophorae]|uniref:GNAT family N-acetyltransferase n=1 Tax=Paenibacillus sophorae TaxID=1333845 RepID=A0A1H8PMD9_9BACL|nr:GNAT family N-acetyltransferase [Paenibacillus sophorae]QWU16626.1 GNAT family N-acetyltransferase [Paenibacillus sophorae]SEO42941.1 Ribosomal protein S18 acetylase RimI [Paenibacillus sophorae]
MEMMIRKASNKDAPALAGLMEQLDGKSHSVRDIELRLDFIEMSPIEDLFVCESAASSADDEGPALLERETNVPVRKGAPALLGCLGFRLRENIEDLTRYGEISLLVTDKAARRQGVGKKLMAFAEQMAAGRGCKGTWLVSGTAREEAHRFYRELGYEITGYRFVKRGTEN